jgi:hypothetical protein
LTLQSIVEDVGSEVSYKIVVGSYQNLEDTAKAVLTGKFIAMRAYVKRTERSQINDLMLHLKLLEEQEQANPKNKQKETNNENKGQN